MVGISTRFSSSPLLYRLFMLPVSSHLYFLFPGRVSDLQQQQGRVCFSTSSMKISLLQAPPDGGYCSGSQQQWWSNFYFQYRKTWFTFPFVCSLFLLDYFFVVFLISCSWIYFDGLRLKARK